MPMETPVVADLSNGREVSSSTAGDKPHGTIEAHAVFGRERRERLAHGVDRTRRRRRLGAAEDRIGRPIIGR